MAAINDALGDPGYTPSVRKSFEADWDNLFESLTPPPPEAEEIGPRRARNDVIDEILDKVRSTEAMVTELRANAPHNSDALGLPSLPPSVRFARQPQPLEQVAVEFRNARDLEVFTSHVFQHQNLRFDEPVRIHRVGSAHNNQIYTACGIPTGANTRLVAGSQGTITSRLLPNETRQRPLCFGQ